MSNAFEVVEMAGVSTVSISDAVKNAVSASEKKVLWFEVTEQRGRVLGDGTLEFQVKVKLGRVI